MKQKRQAPGVQGRRAGAFHQVHYKGKTFCLKNNEFRLFSMLLNGGRWATFDIAERLNIPDPRSTIRYVRAMGIDISDAWTHENHMRFKRYFIHRDDLSDVRVFRLPELFDSLDRKEVHGNG